MTHLLYSHPTTPPWSSRIPAGALAAGRFVLHFGEMCLAMQLGMLMFMPVASLIPASLQQIAMALVMAAPMVAWMRLRGHGWRHGIEMALAMLVPWAAVLGLNRLGAAHALPFLAQADGVAMYLGMLGIMLVLREHYARGHQQAMTHDETRPARRIPWRKVLLVGAYLSAILLVPPIIGIANVSYKAFGAIDRPQPPTYSGVLPAPPTPDPTKKIAVVLSGPRGSEIGDTLEAYEILARSGVFNVYSVAPERTVLPLIPGFGLGAPSSLDFVPHYSFAEYDAQIGRPPDLIAIPFLGPERDEAVLDWIRGHFGSNTTLLGICAGTATLADTGLADGHTATTNTEWFSYAEAHAPTTTWLHNLRYVDDGKIVTSSNLTSGIDATLHVVDRFAGRATALDVARQIGYTHTGALDDPRFDPPDNFLLPIVINAGLESPHTQQLGVLLYDGVTELGLSGLVDPYYGSGSARTFVTAPERGIVRSRDGFQFVPGYDFSSVPNLDRVLVPAGENDAAKRQVIAAWSTSQPGRTVQDIYQNVGAGQTAYDASIADLARRHNASLALAVANGLFYSTDGQFPDAAWPISQVLTWLVLALLGAAAVFGATHLRQSRRARMQPAAQAA